MRSTDDSPSLLSWGGLLLLALVVAFAMFLGDLAGR